MYNNENRETFLKSLIQFLNYELCRDTDYQGIDFLFNSLFDKFKKFQTIDQRYITSHLNENAVLSFSSKSNDRRNRYSPLALAAANDNTKGIILLLCLGVNVNEVRYVTEIDSTNTEEFNNKSALIVASIHGYLYSMKLLVNAGIEIDYFYNKKTAFVCAIDHEHSFYPKYERWGYRIPAYLLSAGASVIPDTIVNFYKEDIIGINEWYDYRIKSKLLNISASTHYISFCQAACLAKLGNFIEAESRYQRIISEKLKNKRLFKHEYGSNEIIALYRKLGDLHLLKNDFSLATKYYIKAVEDEDLRAIDSLVTLAKEWEPLMKRKLSQEAPVKKEQSFLSSIYSLWKENKKEEAPPIHKNTLLELCHGFVNQFDLLVHLAVDQWIFLVLDAETNPYYKEPMSAAFFSISATRIVQKIAKTDNEKKEAKKVMSHTWNLFRALTDKDCPQQGQNLQVAMQEAKIDSAKLIASYCENEDEQKTVKNIFHRL